MLSVEEHNKLLNYVNANNFVKKDNMFLLQIFAKDSTWDFTKKFYEFVDPIKGLDKVRIYYREEKVDKVEYRIIIK